MDGGWLAFIQGAGWYCNLEWFIEEEAVSGLGMSFKEWCLKFEFGLIINWKVGLNFFKF